MSSSSTATQAAPGREPSHGVALDDVCIRIFETDFDYVYRSLLRMGVSAADAEDLAQEVFLVMWRRREDWDAERPLRPWLFGVALRVAHEHRHRMRREAPAGIVDQTDDRPYAEDQLASARARALVLQAIAVLPEKQRAVLILHEIEGTPMREVAEALGVPLFTAYTRLRAARQSFARAVRRLELAGPRATRPDEKALLALERERVVPAEVRRRTVERLRALLPTLPAPMPAAPFPSWALPGAAVAACGLLAVVAVARGGHGVELTRAAHSALLPAAAEPAPAPARIVQPAASRELGQGLVGYWRFEDRPGSRVARDLSGAGNDCLLHRFDLGRSSVKGVAGQALRFDGLGHLACGTPQTVEAIGQAMTVAGWIKLDQRDPDLRAVLAWQRGRGSARFGLFFGMTGSKLLLGSDVWGRIEAPLDRTIGRWVHVAATHGEDGMKRLYIDGVEVASDGGPRVPLGSGNHPLTVGGHINYLDARKITQRLHGAIDELALFKRALSGAEIAALASEETPARLAQLTSP
jgi:RNA polymerase sigma-70 factor (ECF subfamily)